jgi:hypothetical protein
MTGIINNIYLLLFFWGGFGFLGKRQAEKWSLLDVLEEIVGKYCC